MWCCPKMAVRHGSITLPGNHNLRLPFAILQQWQRSRADCVVPIFNMLAHAVSPFLSAGGPPFYSVRVTAYGCSFWTEFISVVRRALGRKVTTLRAEIIIASPVLGFRPLRGGLLRTVNLPKPKIVIGSPVRRMDARISRVPSSNLAASFPEIPVADEFAWQCPPLSSLSFSFR